MESNKAVMDRVRFIKDTQEEPSKRKGIIGWVKHRTFTIIEDSML